MNQFWILILAVALLAGCSSESNPLGVDGPTNLELEAEDGVAANQNATTTTVRTTGYLDVELPFGGGDVACVGERVRVYGPVAIRIHTTIDGQGRPHQMAYYNWKDVVAVGLTSGNTWHTSAALELYTLFNFEPAEPHQPAPGRTPLGEPGVFHHTGAIQFISDGEAPDLYVRHLVQTVLDANGQVRVDTDLLELLECR